MTTSAITQVTPVDCATDLKSYFVVDVRSSAERASDLGYLAPSHHVDLAKVLAGDWNPPVKDAKILCVCRSGIRSMRAAEALAARGFTNLYNLAGGMLAWQAASLPRVVIAASPGGVPPMTLCELRDGILDCFVDSMVTAPKPMTAAEAEHAFRAALNAHWEAPTAAALHDALASLASAASLQGVPLEIQSRNLATFSSMLAWCA